MSGIAAGPLAACIADILAGVGIQVAVITGACTPLLVVPPAYIACAGLAPLVGLLAEVLAGQQCQNAGASSQSGQTSDKSVGGRAAAPFWQFQAFDINGDGYWDSNDLPTHAPIHPAIRMVLTSIMTYHDALDQDSDGRISPDEVLAFNETASTDHGALRLMFDKMDRDKSGTLTPNELTEDEASWDYSCPHHGDYALDGMYDALRHADKGQRGYITYDGLCEVYDAQPKCDNWLGLCRWKVTRVYRPTSNGHGWGQDGGGGAGWGGGGRAWERGEVGASAEAKRNGLNETVRGLERVSRGGTGWGQGGWDQEEEPHVRCYSSPQVYFDGRY